LSELQNIVRKNIIFTLVYLVVLLYELSSMFASMAYDHPVTCVLKEVRCNQCSYFT